MSNQLDQSKLSELQSLESKIQSSVSDINGILSFYASNGLTTCNARSRAGALVKQVSQFKDFCRDKMITSEAKIQEIKDQRASDEKLKAGFEGYMKDEKKKLKGYCDGKEKYYNMAKNAVSTLNAKELGKLSSGNCEGLFCFLFELLYNGQPNQFRFGQFKKLALGADAEDFQARLAVFDLSKLHKNPNLADQLDQTRKASYPETNDNNSLIDLLAWMDYIHECYLSDIEVKQQQKIINEQEAKFGERIMKVQVSQDVVNAHTQTVNYLKTVLEQLSQIESKLDLIQKYDNLPHQAQSEEIVNLVTKANSELEVTPDVY